MPTGAVSTPALPAVSTDYLAFGGGYDTETPLLSVPPGRVRFAQNYEVSVTGGYRDIVGFERFDGQPKPSSAVYAVQQVTITGSFAVGDVVTQQVSGASATVIAVTSTYLAYTKVSGAFDNSHDLEVSSVVQGTATSLAVVGGAPSSQLNAQYLNLAADQYRVDINAVPGSGSVLGVAFLNDVWYAWRNNAGGTAAAFYKSSSGGWTSVDLGRQVSFTSGGTYQIQEGDTITGTTSGATALVKRIIVTSGGWGTADAAGKLVLAGQSGTFQAENLNVGANPNVATIAGDSTAITLLPGGSFETYASNFAAPAQPKRLYGCDGVNQGFEFDGTTWVPIDSGMVPDTPNHVVVHRDYLFFSFGPSLQRSGLTTPYLWTPLLGADQIATRDDITGFAIETGTQASAALLVANRNSMHVLYGKSEADWDLQRYREEVGAYAGSIQQVGRTMFMDDRGITTFAVTQDYGNFLHATISAHIKRFINAKRLLTRASCVVREKSQYRVFFSDGSALYVTMDGNKLRGMMPILFDRAVTCIASVEDSSGSEQILFGSDDGYVYQLDKGTSFDGERITGYLYFHPNFFKSHRQVKKFLPFTIEVEGEGYAEFNLSYELGLGDPDLAQPALSQQSIDIFTVLWDAFQWDAFIWDAGRVSPQRCDARGSAESIAIAITRSNDYAFPMTFNGAVFPFIKRRRLR